MTVQIAAITAFVGAQEYGTVGSYYLREQFTGIESITDALYYVVVTDAAVGYGDAAPVTTEAKLFSLSVIVTGTAAFTVTVGTLIAPAIESRMVNTLGYMTASELDLLGNHVVRPRM